LRRVILHDERRNLDRTVAGASARLGRDPALDIPTDPTDDVVSAVHARVWREADGSWWLEDLGSTNGTWLGGRRIGGPERLHSGDRFTLGQRGPAFRVAIGGEPAADGPEPPAEASRPLLRLRRVNGGDDLAGSGREILIGRASSCAIALRTVADTLVSKRHAVVAFDAEGGATIADLRSKNGTFVNGQQIRSPTALKAGDRVMLGWHGPLFEVRALGAASVPEGQGAEFHPERQPAKTLTGMVQVASAERGPGRFVRSLVRQMTRESSASFRVGAVALIVALSVGIVLVYRSASRESAAARARLASAERAFTDQLRSASESQRRADSDIARLQRDLVAAQRATVSRAVVDSLQTLLREAERRAGSGADFSRVAAENQGAVGLVVVRYDADSVMGSGFVITPSGYLLTNGHVVDDPNRGRPRGIDVVMADTRSPLAADVVAVSDIPDQDVAVLKIRGYRGAAVRAIDWQGRHVRQGEPAALIGFPRGTLLAFDATGLVRTTMFAGIIAKATSDWIEFAGSTDAGSSGSPLFNAAGEVIAMHYGAYAPPAPGQGASLLGFAIPIGRARAWLPREARTELGL
jgi:pSer/pThr/pTyr-binding forkhead associated (FHA) protein/S1-C subfamily serine protease